MHVNISLQDSLLQELRVKRVLRGIAIDQLVNSGFKYNLIVTGIKGEKGNKPYA